MHASSKVEHDLVYKPDTGTLSKEEHAILDELNGLVIPDEIALERLRDVIEARVSNSLSIEFANKYDLASYIYNKIGTKKHGLLSISNLDATWSVLRN